MTKSSVIAYRTERQVSFLAFHHNPTLKSLALGVFVHHVRPCVCPSVSYTGS